MTTDTLQWLTVSGGPTYIKLASQMALFSGSYAQTALYSFRLDGRFSPLAAFAVASTSSYNPAAPGPSVIYDQVMVNEGGGWNSSENAFIVPITGVYFISFTISGPATNALLSFQSLTVNDTLLLTIGIIDDSHNGVEMARGSVMVLLNNKDVVQFQV